MNFLLADGEGLLQDELLLVADGSDVAQGVEHAGVVKLGHWEPEGGV